MKPANDPKNAPRNKAGERMKGWQDDPEAQKPKNEHDRSNEADDVPDGEE